LSRIPSDVLRAAQKYGTLVDPIARQYTNPVTGGSLSGAALLLKLVSGESGFNPGSVSSVGARGYTQFMPESRQEAISRFGVDPWANADQALHGAALHLLGKINGSKGLAGYNPGMPTYTNYILGQKIGSVSAPGGGSPSSHGAPSPQSPVSSSTTVTAPQLDTSPAEGITGLLAGLQAQERPVIQTAGVASPAFSAEKYLSAPASPVSAGVSTPQPSNLADLLANLPQGAVNTPGTVKTTTTHGAKPADQITKPGSAPNQLASFIERANQIDAQHLPYLWGGGHGAKVTNTRKTQPLDCSGAVSAVLGIDPRVSGQFETFGSPGPSPSGKGITIYANKTHVLMEINGHFFATSHANPGGGAGWVPRSQIGADYLKNFTARHIARFG
jgi:hypothetical protein